jgi:hypothetical protein
MKFVSQALALRQEQGQVRTRNCSSSHPCDPVRADSLKPGVETVFETWVDAPEKPGGMTSHVRKQTIAVLAGESVPTGIAVGDSSCGVLGRCRGPP